MHDDLEGRELDIKYRYWRMFCAALIIPAAGLVTPVAQLSANNQAEENLINLATALMHGTASATIPYDGRKISLSNPNATDRKYLHALSAEGEEKTGTEEFKDYPTSILEVNTNDGKPACKIRVETRKIAELIAIAEKHEAAGVMSAAIKDLSAVCGKSPDEIAKLFKMAAPSTQAQAEPHTIISNGRVVSTTTPPQPTSYRLV